MINLVWRTDIHFSDKSPQSRTDNWKEALLDKISQVGEIAREVKAHAVLDGGDLFHVKSPGRTSHELVRSIMEAQSTYPCPTYACIGNHDVVYGDYTYIHQQPLGVLFSSGVLNRLYDEHEVTFEAFNNSNHCNPFRPGRPAWVESFKVRVVGIPYHGVRYDWDRFTSIKKGDEDYLVVVAHVLASEKGGSMFEGEDIIKYSDLKSLDPDVFCFGHWHKDQGVTEISPGKWVVNVGSLSRGSLSQDNLDRVPRCAVLGFSESGINIETRDLKVAATSEIFDLEGKERQEAQSDVIESFVGKLDGSFELNKGEDLSEIVQGLDISTEVRERVVNYIERAQGGRGVSSNVV